MICYNAINGIANNKSQHLFSNDGEIAWQTPSNSITSIQKRRHHGKKKLRHKGIKVSHLAVIISDIFAIPCLAMLLIWAWKL
jgi:hypothetical protein